MKIILTESQFKRVILKEEYGAPDDVEGVAKELVNMGFNERRYGTDTDKYIRWKYKGKLKDCPPEKNTINKIIEVTYFENPNSPFSWSIMVGKCGTIFEKESYWNNPNSDDPLSTDNIIELVSTLKNKFM